MKDPDDFLNYIYSAAALDKNILEKIKKGNGIFRKAFFNEPTRKKIIKKFQHSLSVSDGGVFLVCGYRGTGKTSFVNYILDELKPAGKYISCKLNLSSFEGRNLRFELMCRITLALKEKLFTSDFSKDIQTKLTLLENTLLWNIEHSREAGVSLGLNILNAGGKVSTSSQVKDNLYYAENGLRDILKELNDINWKRVILVLDELDKIPFLNNTNEKKEKKDGKGTSDWLLKMLSEVKDFLFESGVIFILIVNKDIYDAWQSSWSQEDLLMNLVTDVVYVPSYLKEEMQINFDFPFKIDSTIHLDSQIYPDQVKDYFENCLYFESYATPRLYFQQLSLRIDNGQIDLSRIDTEELHSRIKLFRFNNQLYNYVFKDDYLLYKQILPALNLLSTIISLLPKSHAESAMCTAQQMIKFQTFFKVYLRKMKKTDKQLARLWNINTGDDQIKKGEYIHFYFETLCRFLKNHDKFHNFPAINYINRRLTDFVKLIETRGFISIDELYDEMNFHDYETRLVSGRYLITLLIPLNLVILFLQNLIRIEDCYIYYTGNLIKSVKEINEGYRLQIQGKFEEAYDHFTLFINFLPDIQEVYFAKFQIIFYMLKLGFHSDKIDLMLEWQTCLKNMKLFVGRGIKKEPVHANALYGFLNNLYQKISEKNGQENKKEEIESNFNQAIEEELFNPDILEWKGYYHYWEHEYSAALECFEASTCLYRNPMVMLRAGDCWFHLKEYERAVERYKSAHDLTTNWLQRALLLISTSRLIEKVTEEQNYEVDLIPEKIGITIEQVKIFYNHLKEITPTQPNYYYIIHSLNVIINTVFFSKAGHDMETEVKCTLKQLKLDPDFGFITSINAIKIFYTESGG